MEGGGGRAGAGAQSVVGTYRRNTLTICDILYRFSEVWVQQNSFKLETKPTSTKSSENTLIPAVDARVN